VASAYFLLEPTDTNRKNNFPTSKPFVATTPNGAYHLENVALLPWYLGPSADLALVWSFPDANALSAGAQPCPSRDMRRPAPPKPDVPPAPLTGAPNGHQLIGYWSGYGGPGSTFPLTEISPQWDVIIVAFATPDQNAEEGTLTFHAPVGLDPEQFKADVAAMKQHGKKVMISLGGGGQFFSLDDPKHISNFVSSVGDIVRTYGFDGVDIDFESPSLEIAAGDTDFTHPTTPSIVNLIAGLRQLRDEFGPSFMISLVPEGTQIPAGHSTYGGQFGSYLPIAYGLRDILSFMDVQDYNTPPIEGLDGEIYQAGTLDYHAAVTELVLRGFSVGGKGGNFFSPLPEKQAAVGFLIGETTPPIVQQAMDYIITGKAPAGTRYKLLRPRGYRDMIGAMFWTIDADRGENYRFSNTVGPQLHGYPVPK
jgi:chitinase